MLLGRSAWRLSSSEREHLFFPGRLLRAARPCCLKNYFLFAGGCAFDAKYDSTNGLARSYVIKNTNQPAMTIAAHLSREDMRNSLSRATTWPKPLGIYHDVAISSTTKLIRRFGTKIVFLRPPMTCRFIPARDNAACSASPSLAPMGKATRPRTLPLTWITSSNVLS